MKLLDLFLFRKFSNHPDVRLRDEPLDHRIIKGGLLEGGLLYEVPNVGLWLRGLPLF